MTARKAVPLFWGVVGGGVLPACFFWAEPEKAFDAFVGSGGSRSLSTSLLPDRHCVSGPLARPSSITSRLTVRKRSRWCWLSAQGRRSPLWLGFGRMGDSESGGHPYGRFWWNGRLGVGGHLDGRFFESGGGRLPQPPGLRIAMPAAFRYKASRFPARTPGCFFRSVRSDHPISAQCDDLVSFFLRSRHCSLAEPTAPPVQCPA